MKKGKQNKIKVLLKPVIKPDCDHPATDRVILLMTGKQICNKCKKQI